MMVYGHHVEIVFFFFSSRRRHTRFDCDWSSDVCSSDLGAEGENRAGARADGGAGRAADHGGGAGEQGHPEGDGARVGGERRGGAGGVVGAGGHLGGEPNHDLLVNRASSTVPGGSSLTTRSGSRSLADVARCKGDVRQQRVSP